MIKIYPKEVFKEIKLPPSPYRYAISNFARLIRFTDSFTDGELIKPRVLDKRYHVVSFSWNYKKKMKSKVYFIRRLVAENFCVRKSIDCQFVISLDYNLKNELPSNLRWVTRKEQIEHQKNSPLVKRQIENLREINKRRDGKKLTTIQAIRLKKLIMDENRKTRYKILAKQFGVSEMEIYRIKRGEIWGHIKI